MTVLMGVDLGKTGGRARLMAAGVPTPVVECPGACGLADAGGVAKASSVVRTLVQDALTAAGLGDRPVDGLVVGAAGAEAHPRAAEELALALRDELRTPVAVASDSVTAHAGALGGRPGVVLAMGTGAVAVAVGNDGEFRQLDGWGYWLGDDGGGSWIGRQALRAALLAMEGRGSETALSASAELRFGPLTGLPSALASEGQVAASTASFVPDVVRCAGEGDAVAQEVLADAARLLADTAAAAAAAVGAGTVTAVGGLTRVDSLMALWRARLPDELAVVPALGSPLDGAVLLAQRTDLPHESRVLRLAGPSARGAARESTPGPVDVDTLETEQVQADLLDLDRLSPAGLVDALLDAEATVPSAVHAARDTIVQAVNLIEGAFDSGGRLVYVGAGTPGRLAALDAAECPPTFGTPPAQVVAVLAGGDQAAAAAVEGAEDDAEAGRRDLLRAAVSARDVVVGISASGRTPYVLAALAAARESGAATVAVVNNADSEARAVADVTIELRTGAEVLAGSTRLKAGTSQKVVLNALSTAAMVRSGKSFGAWMVDVQTSNEKLRRRARRIVREATGADDETALRALRQADWHTKTALVAILADVDVSRAGELLDGAGGRVRDAIAAGTRRGSAEEASL